MTFHCPCDRAIEAFTRHSTIDYLRLSEFVANHPQCGADTTLTVSVIALKQSSMGSIISGFPRAVFNSIRRFSSASWFLVLLLVVFSLVLIPSKARYWQFMGLSMFAICSGFCAFLFYGFVVRPYFVIGLSALGSMIAVALITGYGASRLAPYWCCSPNPRRPPSGRTRIRPLAAFISLQRGSSGLHSYSRARCWFIFSCTARSCLG